MRAEELALLLRRVDQVRRLSPRDHLRVQRILRSDLAQDRAELRAALASALAQDDDQWQRIAARFDECVGAAPLLAQVGLAPQADVVQALAPRRVSSGARWARAALRLGLGLLVLAQQPRVAVQRVPEQRGPEPPCPECVRPPPPDILVRTLQEERSAPDPTWQPAPYVEGTATWLALGVLGALLALLGARLVWLPSGIARRRQEAADAERLRLSRDALRDDDPLRPVYHVDGGLPFDAAVVDDCAVHLGRLFRPQPGLGLDVAATVRRSIQEGGQLTLVPEQRRAARELLVLIDHETGDHPWLWGVLRLLDAWQRRGVNMLRLRFNQMPWQLWPERDGAPLTLAQLSRSHAQGAVLLIISRSLVVRGELDEGEWLAELAAWPVCAWLDPDPRAEERCGPGRRGDIQRLRGLGLLRFPYSDAGLRALAWHLCQGGSAPPPWPPLPTDAAVQQQVLLLATVAAMVPKPTWEQIDGLRRLLGGEFSRLTGPWYVHSLLLLLRGDLDREDPRGLSLSPEAEDRLIRSLRLEDSPGPAGGAGPLEQHVRERLLKEIADDKDGAPGPAGALWRARRDLARARHQAVLEPQRAAEIYAPFLGGALDYEARALAQVEADRQPAAGGFAGVRALLQATSQVRPGELWGGGPRSLLGAAVVALLWLWGVGWSFGGIDRLARLGRPALTAEVLWPRTREVLRRPPVVASASVPPPPEEWRRSTPARARMVKIPAGRFLMGSPAEEKGRFSSDEVQRSVRISRAFLLGVTEVTQGQYQQVMGSNPSYFKKGASYPVEQVSWLDAVAYCNKLSALEGLEPCYTIKGETVAWPKRLACTGYRLPTEAEWEYAARGKPTVYAGSDNLDDVGWYRDNAGGGTRPVAKKASVRGLYDMSGNVWEWVWDWYGAYPAGAQTDPIGSSTGRSRVSRGGSWGFDAVNARVAGRGFVRPGNRDHSLGFRLARSLP